MAVFSGWFSDGRTAARTQVTVELEPTALRIVDQAGETRAVWTLDAVRFVDDPPLERALRLRSANDPDGRLVVEDERFLAALRAALGEKARSGADRARVRTALYLAAGAAGLVVLLLVGMPLAVDIAARVAPVSWERAVGEQIAAQMLDISGECRESKGRSALLGLTARLAAAAHAPYRFHLRVADASAVNAFAAPGGHIVVNRGLIEFVESPEEIAGVLAHEMGHALERHATRAVVRELGLSALLSIVGGARGVTIDAASVGRSLLTNAYSRSAETEADEIAIRILNAADISGSGYAAFFARLGERQRGSGGFYSSHPANSVRAAAARRRASGSRPAMTAAEWQAIRRMCEAGGG